MLIRISFACMVVQHVLLATVKRVTLKMSTSAANATNAIVSLATLSALQVKYIFLHLCPNF